MRVVSFTGKDGEWGLGVCTEKGVIDLSASAHSAGIPAGAFASMAAFLEGGGRGANCRGPIGGREFAGTIPGLG